MLPLLLALACSQSPAPEAAPARPNVLVFTLDTLRTDGLVSKGNPRGPTPELD